MGISCPFHPIITGELCNMEFECILSFLLFNYGTAFLGRLTGFFYGKDWAQCVFFWTTQKISPAFLFCNPHGGVQAEERGSP